MPSLSILLPWVLAVACAAALGWRVARDRRETAARVRDREQLAHTTLTLTRIRQSIESASDAIGIGDMEGTSLYHNRAHVALFGYTVEELNAVPEGGVLFADAVVAKAVHAAIRGGYSWAGETEIRTKAGRLVPCFVRADIIRDEQERPVGIFGVFTDITERRRTQRLLDEQRQRLEVTLQSIGDAVITVDVQGRVVLVNPAAQDLTGISQAQAAGRALDEVLALRDETTRTPCPSDALALLREQAASRSANVYWFVTAGGAERLVAENAALIRTAANEVVGAVLALRDITRDRQRSDEAARAGKLESLGLMAGSIAHDFGNLLTAMVGHLSMAQLEPNLPPKAKTRLDDVERVVWRARDVTRQLTTFARGGVVQKKVVQLGPVVREAAGLAVNGTAVELACDVAEDLWSVEADEGQLVQVINNLAVNAVQAMPQGGRLSITAANVDRDANSQTPTRDGRWIRLAVTDTGTGIPPEHLQKIFEPFFTTKPKGTGLGLATSYSVIKKHGGQLRVESAVGRGTTFHVLLPAVAANSAPPFAAAARRTLGRVLLLDDEKAVRESVSLMLGLLNYDVVAVADGDEAVGQYQAARGAGRPFHAVLLDLKIPGGVGAVAALEKLRAIDAAVKAIIISAHPDDPVMADFRAAGFVAAVAKPFKMSDLAAVLREVTEAAT